MPRIMCESQECVGNKSNGRLYLLNQRLSVRKILGTQITGPCKYIIYSANHYIRDLPKLCSQEPETRENFLYIIITVTEDGLSGEFSGFK